VSSHRRSASDWATSIGSRIMGGFGVLTALGAIAPVSAVQARSEDCALPARSSDGLCSQCCPGSCCLR
jgi:hypothetical protein